MECSSWRDNRDCRDTEAWAWCYCLLFLGVDSPYSTFSSSVFIYFSILLTHLVLILQDSLLLLFVFGGSFNISIIFSFLTGLSFLLRPIGFWHQALPVGVCCIECNNNKNNNYNDNLNLTNFIYWLPIRHSVEVEQPFSCWQDTGATFSWYMKVLTLEIVGIVTALLLASKSSALGETASKNGPGWLQLYRVTSR